MVIVLLQDGAQRVYLAACGQGRQRYVADFSIVHSIEKMRYNPDSMAFECSYNGDGSRFFTINSADMGFSDEQQSLKFRSRLLTRPGVSVNAPFGSRTSRPNVPTTVESPTMSGGDGHCVGLSLLALGHRIDPVLSQRHVNFVDAAESCCVDGRVNLIKVDPENLHTTLMQSKKDFIVVIEDSKGGIRHTIAVKGVTLYPSLSQLSFIFLRLQFSSFSLCSSPAPLLHVHVHLRARSHSFLHKGSDNLFIDPDRGYGTAPRTDAGLKKLGVVRFVLAREVLEQVQQPKIHDALVAAGCRIKALEDQPGANMKAACAIVEASVRQLRHHFEPFLVGFQLCATPHAPHGMVYFAIMLIGCRLVLSIQCHDQITSSGPSQPQEGTHEASFLCAEL